MSHSPNTKPASTYPATQPAAPQKGSQGTSTGGTLKPAQRPSNVAIDGAL